LKSLLAIVVAILMVFTVFLVITPAVATPNENASDKGKANSQFTIPKNAVEISKGVFSLGQANDVDGKAVEGIMFIDYKEKNAKPEGTPGKGSNKNGGGDETVSCFAFIAKGAKWNVPEDYLLNPSNNDALDENYVVGRIAQSMASWEKEAGNEIFGVKTVGVIDGADTSSTDGKNEIFFGNIASEGALAVTIVWYERGGPPSQRDIVEYDMIFDDGDYIWDDVGLTSETYLVNTAAFDFWGVAAHEIGHAAGMDHPNNSCLEETMFASATNGETKKRTLHDGDKAGILDLFS